MAPLPSISITYPSGDGETQTTSIISLSTLPPPLTWSVPNSTEAGQYTYSGLHDSGTLPVGKPDSNSLLSTAAIIREVSNAEISKIVDCEAAEQAAKKKRKADS